MGHVFSAGDCPVCPGSSEAFVLSRRDTMGLVYHCPFCGCAWAASPTANPLEPIHDLATLAPSGVRLPRPDEVAGVPGVVEVDPGHWMNELTELVAAPPCALHRGR